jgi:hypothetical protein
MDQKPGYKTSEFWLHTVFVVASAAMSILNSFQALGGDQGWVHGALAGLGVVLGGLGSLGYSNNRTAVKVAAINADAYNPVNPSTSRPLVSPAFGP